MVSLDVDFNSILTRFHSFYCSQHNQSMTMNKSVSDFGLARQLSPQLQEDHEQVISLDDRHALPVTRAPECLDDSSSGRLVYSLKSDVFMFGCTLWEMMTLTKPFSWLGLDGSDLVQHRKEMKMNDMETMKSFHSNLKERVKMAIPRGVVRLMLRCLMDNPESRPSMDEVVAELKMESEKISRGDAQDDLIPFEGRVPTMKEVMGMEMEIEIRPSPINMV